jgi:hypothetical protein
MAKIEKYFNNLRVLYNKYVWKRRGVCVGFDKNSEEKKT